MPEFRVLPELDLTADTPRDAACLAREIQLDSDSTATEFTLTSSDDNIAHTVDLRLIDPAPW